MVAINYNFLELNFYGVSVKIRSTNLDILELIEKDFYFFKSYSPILKKADFFLTLNFETPPQHLIPEIQSSFQTQSSICFNVDKIRFNDYYGELISKIDFNRSEAILFSENLDKLHEVAYLIILSRVGKILDLKSVHKLHAFAIKFKDIAFVCMMPSKGGKSTLLLELLKNKNVQMISDDIPLFNWKGDVLPFPIKIGVNQFENEIEVKNPESNIYKLKRTLYGEKTLISIKGIPNKVVDPNIKIRKIILCEAFRFNSSHSNLVQQKWTKTFKGLFKHGIIGIGLPMIIEYFWEDGLLDFLKKFYIFVSRLFVFTLVSIKAKKMQLRLGKRPSVAAKEILDYLDKI